MNHEKIKQLESAESELFEKFSLNAGETARFQKVALGAASSVPVGSISEGVLKDDVEIGQPICFSNSDAMTSTVKKVWEENGELHIETSTSEYKLLRERVAEEGEEFGFNDIAHVVTERGSVYRYLPNGQTQRYKEAEKSLRPSKDVLVYVPNFESVKDKLSPEALATFGKDGQDFEETMLEYIHSEDKRVNVVDRFGEPVETNAAVIKEGGDVYLSFGDRVKTDFTIPVSHIPKIGYSTFDKGRSKEGVRQHLGNKVTKIVLKS
jgi:hypothetical protein